MGSAWAGLKGQAQGFGLSSRGSRELLMVSEPASNWIELRHFKNIWRRRAGMNSNLQGTQAFLILKSSQALPRVWEGDWGQRGALVPPLPLPTHPACLAAPGDCHTQYREHLGPRSTHPCAFTSVSLLPQLSEGEGMGVSCLRAFTQLGVLSCDLILRSWGWNPGPHPTEHCTLIPPPPPTPA